MKKKKVVKHLPPPLEIIYLLGIVQRKIHHVGTLQDHLFSQVMSVDCRSLNYTLEGSVPWYATTTVWNLQIWKGAMVT